MDHVGINAASPQPTGQPKTIPSGLIRNRNPRDLLPRLDGLVTPTIQKPCRSTAATESNPPAARRAAGDSRGRRRQPEGAIDTLDDAVDGHRCWPRYRLPGPINFQKGRLTAGKRRPRSPPRQTCSTVAVGCPKELHRAN